MKYIFVNSLVKFHKAVDFYNITTPSNNCRLGK